MFRFGVEFDRSFDKGRARIDSRDPMAKALLILSLAGLCASAATGQNGDKSGEVQADLPDDLVVPPAPILTPAEQLKTFRLPPGFRIDLVAAEPLVVDPVAMAFDEEGRLWVAEMRGYMGDADGNGEQEPTGVIAVLEDRDGDGVMDTRGEFLSGLVLPRAVQPTRGGALIIAPPNLIFAQDSDGDGEADQIEVIESGLAGIPNPEHAINGLDPTFDGWFRVANEPLEFAWRDGSWQRRTTRGGGQWGITHDDEGLAFFNTNSDPLRGDFFPSHYAIRNPSHGTIRGANERLVQDRSVYPARINPGVNRGYRPATLREDFTLATSTGACGPWVYRGGILGANVQGNAFVCEPTANVVQRFAFAPAGAFGLKASNANPGLDFLSSTDERFRPVNLTGGPDGGLYIADFARGLIQHRIYLTSFLRKQAEQRALVEPHALGRIWRVTRDGGERHEFTPMSTWSWEQLIQALSHPSGWIRDTAQRVIVEQWEPDTELTARIQEIACSADQPLASLHALWILHGIEEVTPAVVRSALEDQDGRVLRAAMRVGENWLATGNQELTHAYREAIASGSPRTKRQGVLSLGEARSELGDRALVSVLEEDCSAPEIRAAALSGLGGRELAFLERLLQRHEWIEERAGSADLFTALARCVVREGIAERVEHLLRAIAAMPPNGWRAEAMARGVLAGRRKGPRGEFLPVRLLREPVGLVGTLPTAVSDQICWPGRAGCEAVEVRPMTALENQAFARGRKLFADVCAGCHRPSGLGDPGLAPQLRDQPLVLGHEGVLVRILTHGLQGPITVEGHRFDSEMPATGFSAEDLAAVATYIRREWGHGAEPVTVEAVRQVEAATAGRNRPWTIDELGQLELD